MTLPYSCCSASCAGHRELDPTVLVGSDWAAFGETAPLGIEQAEPVAALPFAAASVLAWLGMAAQVMASLFVVPPSEAAVVGAVPDALTDGQASDS